LEIVALIKTTEATRLSKALQEKWHLVPLLNLKPTGTRKCKEVALGLRTSSRKDIGALMVGEING
jgi:hypothetical protein